MAGVRSSAEGPKGRARPRIVVADDDDLMREFYVQVLASLGYDVVGSAADGAELVAACEANPVDLVVTDIRMPSMSGIDAARIIAERREVPFLFVSAYHDEILVKDVPPRIRYAYLKKPIKEEHLAVMVRAALKGVKKH
jgi:response regulator NasT